MIAYSNEQYEYAGLVEDSAHRALYLVIRCQLHNVAAGLCCYYRKEKLLPLFKCFEHTLNA